ncbi:proteasome assembly chaperone family protein [candidate division KSB1 bacterium]
MKLELKKIPKNPIIVEGFPGFGLVGTITTEFLIEQLKAKQIGIIKSDDIPAMIAIHEGKVINPIGIFYDEKTNILIVHIITSVQGIEWELADTIMELAKKVKAKEIISLEGVASSNMDSDKSKCFYYTTNKKAKSILDKNKIEPLKEGIILGVTGALLLDADSFPLSCIFAETHSALPDSIAAAKVIEILDKLLRMKLDTKPLMEQAEKFEKKIKSLMEQTKSVSDIQMKKRLNYVG